MIKFWVWVLRLAGVLTLVLTFIYGLILPSYPDSIDKALSSNQEIDQIFHFAAKKAFEFKKNNGRFPSNKEFESWTEELSKFGFYGEKIRYHVDSYPHKAIQEFGRPTEGGFILSVWRSEWSEYYSSWARQSTLPKKKSDYYIIVNGLTDMLFLFALTAVQFGLAHFLVRKSRITKKSKGTVATRQPLI